MRNGLATFALFVVAIACAQHTPSSTFQCASATGKVTMQTLHSDSLSSSFVICVPKEVAPHFHRYHTENVVVLEGTATMQLGDSSFAIGPGDAIAIPMGTVHAVQTTSLVPLKVISVQSPRFDGTDRVPADAIKR